MAINRALVRAAALGAITGLRSMSGAAQLTRALHQNPPASWPHPLLRRLSQEPFPTIAGLFAGGEMLADKMPFIPARTDPMPLAGRATLGAAVGAAAALLEEQPAWQGAVVGSATAIVGAFAGYHARRWLTTANGLPDPVVATIEDGLTLALGQRALR